MIQFAGLVLAILPTYLFRYNIAGLPTTLLEIVLVAFLFLVAANARKVDLAKIKNLGNINWAIGLFILAGAVATIISPEPIKALGLLKAFIVEPVLFFYAMVILIKSEKDKKTLLKWLFSSAVIISCFGFIQYLTYLNLPTRFWGSGEEVLRITSFFEHPNQLALYLAPLFVMFLTLFLSKVALFRKTWILPTGFIVMSVVLLMTFSRGAWLAVALASGFLLFKKYSWKKILATVAILALVATAITPIRQRIALGISDPSSSAHLTLMKIGVTKILESPLLGNGLFGFRTTLSEANFSGEILNNPHNIFLTFWLEMGLLGLLAFALIVFLSLQRYNKSRSVWKLAAGMFLLTTILQGLVDVPYFKNDLSILFWFIIAMFFV
jgi:O-antigen ligase